MFFTDEAIAFSLFWQGRELYSGVYTPGNDHKISVSVKEVIESVLEFQFRDILEVYSQDLLVDNFQAFVDGRQIADFKVIKGGVATFGMTAKTFLQQHFLTWQPREKKISYSSPEYLTYYAVEDSKVKIKAYFNDASGSLANKEIVMASLSAGKAYTIPVMYAVVVGKMGSYPAFYDVWIESTDGSVRYSYVQRYVYDMARSEQEEYVIFENSLGGIDAFRAYGNTEYQADNTHNIAVLGDELSAYRIDIENKYTKNTGYLDEYELKWIRDFFPALKKYIFRNNILREIVLTEDNVTASQQEQMGSYEFTYRYSDDSIYLNLPILSSNQYALSKPINVAFDSIKESIKLEPRLAEFPMHSLSEGTLIPVQEPFSESWKITNAGAIVNYTIQKINEMTNGDLLYNRFKGYYITESALKKAYPNPITGESAWVGEPFPGVVYVVGEDGWETTGEAPKYNDSVDLNDYVLNSVFSQVVNDLEEEIKGLDIYDVSEAVKLAEAAAAEALKYAELAGQSGELAKYAKEQGDYAKEQGDLALQAKEQVVNDVLFKTPQNLSEEEQAQVKRNIGLQNAIAGLITLPIVEFSAKVNATTATKTVDNIIPKGISFLIVDIGVVEGDGSTPASPELSAVLCPVSGGGRIVFQGTASTKFENFKISVISGSAEKDGMGVEVSTPRSITYKVFQVRYLTEQGSGTFKGSFNSLQILQSVYPTAKPGDYAYVGNPRHLYEWDSSAWQDRGMYITDVDQALDIDSGKAIANKAVAVKLSELGNHDGNIILDNAFLTNVQAVGEGSVPSIVTKNGYYTTDGKYFENSSFTTKIFVVEPNSFYSIKVALPGGSTVATIVFFDSDENVISAIRQAVSDKMIKPSGAFKIGLVGSGAGDLISIKKYESVTVDKIADGAITADKIRDKSVTSEKIGNGAVTENKISFANSKNKFNPNDSDVMLGYYQADKEPDPSESYNLTGYMPVKEGGNYVSSKDGQSLSPRFITFFKQDLSIHSYLSSSTDKIQIPEGVAYSRISVRKADWEKFQFEEGEEPTAYEPYKMTLNTNVLPEIDIDGVSFTHSEYIGKNILSEDKIIRDNTKYINTSNGNVSTADSSVYGYTDYMPIDSRGLVITGGNIRGQVIGHAVYDSDKQYIRGVRQNSVEYQPGDAFVRFSIADTEEIMIEQSLTATTPYEPFKGEKQVISLAALPKEILPKQEETILINLPDKIYAIVGDTLQLFYRGIIQAVNPYNYNIVISCSKGNQYPRYWEYTPKITDVGTTTLTVTLKDDNRNIISTRKCQLITRNAVKSPEKKMNVMCFGDSLTSGGIWCEEADRRLTGTGGDPEGKAFTNIEFVGSKKKGTTGYFGVGGWTWKAYTTSGNLEYRFQVTNVNSLSFGAKYTHNGNTFTLLEINITEGSGNILARVNDLNPAPNESGSLQKISGDGDDTIEFKSVEKNILNPLWDFENSKMTFIPYANEVADGQIDVVYTLLTWNGLTAGKTDFSDVLAEVKVFADTLHSEFPDAKLKIMGVQVPSVTGGMGSSYGATGTGYADGYGMVVTALNMNEAYQEFANRPEYSEFVEFVHASSQVDSEYNMPYKDTPVNIRNKDVTERRGTNGVHPKNEGYYQFADAVYRNFIADFCQ